MNSLYLAIGCFIIAALLGATLLSYVLLNKPTPKGLAIIHGSFAALGLVLLIIYGLGHQYYLISAAIFVLAAFGGLILFYRDLTGLKLPKWLALAHGLTAVIAFALLLVIFFVK